MFVLNILVYYLDGRCGSLPFSLPTKYGELPKSVVKYISSPAKVFNPRKIFREWVVFCCCCFCCCHKGNGNIKRKKFKWEYTNTDGRTSIRTDLHSPVFTHLLCPRETYKEFFCFLLSGFAGCKYGVTFA